MTLSTGVFAQSPVVVGQTYPVHIDSAGRSQVEALETTDGRTYVVHHPGATYISLHFSDFDLGRNDRVIISDMDGNQAYELSGRGKMDSGAFWAQRVIGDTAVIEYVTRGEGFKRGQGFVVDEYAAGFEALWEPQDFEAICGSNNMRNAVCYASAHPTEYARGRAVARLLIQGISLCTGWLASDNNHLVTNEHCITSSSAALNTDYEFGAEASSCNSSNCQLCWAGQVFSGATFIQDSAALDYALVQITSGNPAATYGWLEIDNRDAVVGEQIYIPQHPGGRAKEFAIESTATFDGGVCKVQTVTAAGCSSSSYNDVGYQCDTEGGSSGSPVLARSSHKVIALHHCANCPNRAVPIDLVCAQICSILGGGGGGCSSNSECNDGNACTLDVCSGGSCSNSPASCGPADGCCPSGCSGGSDSDCPTCAPPRASCTENSECCSGKCTGRSGRKTCK